MKYYIDNNYKTFYKSCGEVLNIKNCQYYYPILSLYIKYHNTKNAFKKVNIQNRFSIYKILEKNDFSELTSNKIVKLMLYDIINNL